MDAKTFLRKVLSDDGYYCSFASQGPRAEDKRTQIFHNTIDELVDTGNELNKDGYNIFYALGTFNEWGSRKATNIKNLKAFFFDVDCGPSKVYINQTEGLKALREFTKAVGLPKPLVISSGRGIHVYWFLSESVSYREWLPVAEQLKRYCGVHNFYQTLL